MPSLIPQHIIVIPRIITLNQKFISQIMPLYVEGAGWLADFLSLTALLFVNPITMNAK
jgi:hypothetical protein